MSVTIERLDDVNVASLVTELKSLRERVEAQERELSVLRMQNAAKSRKLTPWDEIRAQFSERIAKLPIDTSEQYQLMTALSTIIRHRFGLRLVRLLTEEQADEATELANTIANWLERRQWENEE